MPCVITDLYQYYDNTLTPVPLPSQTILAIPSADYMRIPVSAVPRILGVNPDITNTALRFGIVATTDNTGEFSFTLPYAADTLPDSPLQKWTILFPDGRMVSGAVPSVAGPLTINDLIASYDWAWSASVHVAPVTQGQLARGSATITADTTASVVFVAPFASTSYVIKLTCSVDSVTGDTMTANYSNKTTTGFDIKTAGEFTGTVDWEASL